MFSWAEAPVGELRELGEAGDTGDRGDTMGPLLASKAAVSRAGGLAEAGVGGGAMICVRGLLSEGPAKSLACSCMVLARGRREWNLTGRSNANGLPIVGVSVRGGSCEATEGADRSSWGLARAGGEELAAAVDAR